MGARAGQVSLAKVEFHLTPENLARIDFSKEDEVREAYEECYAIMFGTEFSHDYLLKEEGAVNTILDVCTELQCPIKLFMLTVMYGHKVANPHSRFYSTMLTGQSGRNRFLKWRQAVEEEYGALDSTSLNKFTGTTAADELTERRLVDSEILAGSWVVGFKMRNAGKFQEPLYRAHELRLNPLWLAIEPSYAQTILIPWQADRKGTTAENKHRTEVALLIGELKKDANRARAVFKIREKIAKKAVAPILNLFDFQPEDFSANESLQSDPLKLWARVGLAIQHVLLTEFYHGNKRSLRKLIPGTFNER